jgi:Concanavalin A-like lectin/glucanases superfamily
MMPRGPRGQRNAKPPYGTPINWQNPLTRGLVVDFLMNEGHGNAVHDGVNGMELRWAGAADLAWIGVKTDLKSQGSEPTLYTAMGGPVFPGGADADQLNNSDVSPFRAFDRLNVSKAMTCEVWLWSDTRPVTFPNPVGLGTTNTDGFVMTWNTAPGFTFRVGTTSADATDSTAAPSDPPQRWQQFIGTFDERATVFPGVAIATPVIYRDGLFRANAAATKTWIAAGNVFRLGNTSFNGNRTAGVYGLVRVWDRALAPEEVASLYVDPFQIYGFGRMADVVSVNFAATVPISITMSGDLTTQIQFAATITVTIAPTATLTTVIQMLAQVAIQLNVPNPLLFAAKMATRLAECGHPMFTKCARAHLGEES